MIAGEVGKERRAVVIAGPTASGKSAAAIAVAEALGGVVINADAMQVYRELRVLTARPSAADEERVPHRLFGVLPAAEACSAARWRDLALTAIDEAVGAGLLPVVVGGTGLYLRALTEGLAPVPAVPEEVRRSARTRHRTLGAEAFHAELRRLDPEMGRRLAPGDSQRMIRAWEVLAATGRSLASFQRETAPGADLRFVRVLLMPDPAATTAAIDARCRAMVRLGALEEVGSLLALGLDPALPAMKALGVAELAACLRGEITLAAATERLIVATRQYAKRQRTWLRHQFAADRTWAAQFSERIWPEICTFIRNAC